MLKKFRTKIDIIDKKLLDLLNQRANIAKQVADYKKSSNNTIIFRPDRESQIIKNLRSTNKGPLNADHIHNIYREIISSCLSLETNLNVSFLGPEGTYSEIATTKFFGSSIEKNSKKNIHEVFDSVKNKYSQFFSLVGIDSIFVIDILLADNTWRILANAPDLFSKDIIKVVLSLFDLETSVLPIIRKRVVLLCTS